MADQDLPGYAPERPLWQPPAVIPSGSVGELARAVQTALAGISGALQQLGGRRNVVPLQGNLDARDGQVIAGVASGQVITLPSPNLGQYGSITVILTAVSSAASVVSPDGSSYTLDQTGVYEFAISPDDTAWRAPPWLSSTGVGFDWSTVLGKGRSSGAHNPKIESGQYIEFGDSTLLLGSGDIRSSSDLDIRAADSLQLVANSSSMLLQAATNLQLRPLSSYLWCNPVGSFYIYTANLNRLQVDTDGTWYLGGDSGSSGEVLTSQGAGSPPIWAAVDLSSVTYTAGDGIDLSSNVFSADVSDFAGTGLEDDGSNNLRIAAAAAGAGLTGGGGSALAIDEAAGHTWTGDHDFQGVVKVDELFVDEQGSSPSVAAGQGLLWVEDRAPNQLVFTDDENADWRLNNSCPEKLTAVQTATNTTNSITCVSFSIPANTLRDNTLYEIDGYLVATRGATATACDLTVDLVLDGTVYATFTVAMFTSETSRHLHVKGHLRCTETGATGRFLANIWGDGNITTADPAPGSTNTTSSGSPTKDTTAALTVLFRANMSAAVSNLSIRWISGSVVMVD